MTDIGRQVWRNWQENSGLCENCPNRDSGGYFSPKTIEDDGYNFDTNPDVLLVADSPGDNHPAESDVGDVKRRCKDSPESHPSSLEESYEGAVEDRQISWLVGESSGQIPAEFFERIGCELRSDSAGNVAKVGGAYYTNAKKCADIYPKDDARVENHAARYRCRSYLKRQLTGLNPEVIVALGRTAFREIIKVLDYDATVTGTFKQFISPNEAVAFESYGTSPPVVPSYHFRTVYRSYTQVGDFDDRYEYWKRLAQRVRSVRDRSG